MWSSKKSRQKFLQDNHRFRESMNNFRTWSLDFTKPNVYLLIETYLETLIDKILNDDIPKQEVIFGLKDDIKFLYPEIYRIIYT